MSAYTSTVLLDFYTFYSFKKVKHPSTFLSKSCKCMNTPQNQRSLRCIIPANPRVQFCSMVQGAISRSSFEMFSIPSKEVFNYTSWSEISSSPLCDGILVHCVQKKLYPHRWLWMVLILRDYFGKVTHILSSIGLWAPLVPHATMVLLS